MRLPALAAALTQLCLLAGSCHSADIRLVDGRSSNEGSVLLLFNGSWGFVCDDGWDLRAASVACRQAGLGQALQHTVANHFDSKFAGRDIVADDIRCRGSEQRLQQCRSRRWGSHDCRPQEAAGVRCSTVGDWKQRPPSWNPLRLPVGSRRQLLPFVKPPYRLSLAPPAADGSSLLLVDISDATGTVCVDAMTLREANVACRELGLRAARLLLQLTAAAAAAAAAPRNISSFPLLAVGNCRGDESALRECQAFGSHRPVPCRRQRLAAAVACAADLPDLQPDPHAVQASAYVVRVPMYHMACALEENCAAPAAFEIQRHDPHWMFASRTLLRFSTIVANEGTAAFLPLREQHHWQWHLCHLHYHSMQHFASYEIYLLRPDGRRILASGHKASFCLEDNVCRAGAAPRFRCSQRPQERGSQGISPGCKDVYLHDLDCQWIDVSELPFGSYRFRLVVNPEFLVAEANFSNNAVACRLHYSSRGAVLTHCSLAHAFDY